MGRASAGALLSLVFCAAVALAACVPITGGGQDPKALEGVEWHLVGSSVSSTDLGAARITITFDGQRLAGFSGVNQYGGSYTAGSDGSLKVGQLTSTLMAGPEPLMKAESAYVKLLEGCDSYKVAGGKLTLSRGGNEQLSYEAAKPAQLPGSKWIVTGYNNGKQAVVSPMLESTLTVGFGSDGTVSGTGGVNTFSGPYTSSAKTIAIGPLTSTRKAGPADLMTQEAAYLAALQKATTYSISQGKLEMRDADGAMQVSANEVP